VATESNVTPTELPFEEAIKFFKGKVRLPTSKWTDIWQGMHARAFVVAGAMKDDLLVDLQSAVLKAMEEGTTLDEFRKGFDETVAKHGWDYKGGRDWRSRVILETNLKTAHQAGRYEQMKAAVNERPFWEYRHGDSRNPRPEHLAWDGLVLRADDPWWDTHYPPNGWGCSCKVFALNGRDMEKMGKSEPDNAPPIEIYEWQPKDESMPPQKVPEGIDPGWAYSVGKAAHGTVYPVPQSVLKGYKERSEQAWDVLTPGDWKSEGLPEQIPGRPTIAKPGPSANNAHELEGLIVRVLGGPQKRFEIPTKGFPLSVIVDARFLAAHLELRRAPMIPLIPELLEDPDEVWISFEKSKATGMVVLGYKIMRELTGLKMKSLKMVANAQSGVVTSWTLVPGEKPKALNRSRVGKLIYRRK
jgi:hypothetical protein